MFRRLIAVTVASVALVSCSTSASSHTAEAPEPAGPTPSHIATMVCAHEAQEKFEKVLGVTATVSHRSWHDHIYSCRFDYPDGSFTLSVKELSSWSQTKAFFRDQQRSQGDTGSIGNLGQGAFRTKDGSILVRKDWKVLTVDISQLPSQFGAPPTSSADVAYTVADLILGCWDGD